MGIQWVERNGKRILYADYTGANTEEMMQNLETTKQMVAGMTGGLLSLTNFSGAKVDMTFMQHLKVVGKEAFEPITEKEALVGIHGVRHILVQAYNTFTGAGEHQRIFDTEEEAIEWLTS